MLHCPPYEKSLRAPGESIEITITYKYLEDYCAAYMTAKLISKSRAGGYRINAVRADGLCITVWL